MPGILLVEQEEQPFLHASSGALLPSSAVRSAIPFARMAGVLAPDGRAPVYLRAIVKLGGHPAREAKRRLIELGPERVIFAHGSWFHRDATARLRRSLRWLVD